MYIRYMPAMLRLLPFFWLCVSAFVLGTVHDLLAVIEPPVMLEYHDPLTQLFAVVKTVVVLLVRMALLNLAWMLEKHIRVFEIGYAWLDPGPVSTTRRAPHRAPPLQPST